MRAYLLALTRNPLSMVGAALTTASGILILILFGLSLVGFEGGPYAGILAKGSANLNDPAWQAKATDEGTSNVVAHGKNKMPKYDKLTSDEVSGLVAYIRTLK